MSKATKHPPQSRREARQAVARFDAAAIAGGRLTIPRAALRFDADAEVDDQADDDGTVAVAMRARSNAVLDHWYFGRIVHDFAGMRPASPKLPFDYCHNEAEVLGYSDEQEIDADGLVMRGRLIPFTDTDRASEVIHKSRRGMEYQGSIYFDPFELVLEYVPQDQAAEVNGDTFEGPGVIARQWMLRGAAVCPYGYDPNTAVALSQSPGEADAVAVSFLESPAMAKKTKFSKKPATPNRHERRKAAALTGKKAKAKPAATKHAAGQRPGKPKTKFEADGDDEDDAEEMEAGDEEDGTETEGDCDCVGEEGCECDEADPDAEEPVEMEGDEDEGEADGEDEADEDDDEEELEATKQTAGKKAAGKLTPAQKEARRFITAFGPQGGIWYASGLSFTQAQAKFNAATQAENAKLKKQVASQAAQLNALRGEADPVTFEPEEAGKKKKAGGKQITGLTSGAAKFAGAIKLPK